MHRLSFYLPNPQNLGWQTIQPEIFLKRSRHAEMVKTILYVSGSEEKLLVDTQLDIGKGDSGAQ